MILQSIKKGFTLIELLVVITIIGILATGATTVFTSQIQKARDSTRVTDIKALLSGIEQVYQDTSEYPVKGLAFSGVTAYVPKFPIDPKTEQGTADSVFDYLYNVGDDENGVRRQEYELSTTFEQNGNITSKAAPDGGDDDNRLEIGLDIEDTIGTENKPTEVMLSTGILAAVATMTCVDPTGGAQSCVAD
jgi:general secretion pathway protein G